MVDTLKMGKAELVALAQRRLDNEIKDSGSSLYCRIFSAESTLSKRDMTFPPTLGQKHKVSQADKCSSEMDITLFIPHQEKPL